ncbi:hypothetical protein BG005_011491 [Podila minutissima]|nr:hypothetical protein BG005_011491 [Podila minutissima]
MAITSDTISNSISDVMKRLNLPAGAKFLKGRAVSSTLAPRKGVSTDGIVAQGHRASSSTFNDFYRISNTTKTNFTDVWTVTGRNMCIYHIGQKPRYGRNMETIPRHPPSSTRFHAFHRLVDQLTQVFVKKLPFTLV